MKDYEVLHGFYVEPLPPTGVDVQRAIRDGRRRNRVRLSATAVGVVLLVVTGAAITPQWLLSSGQGDGPGSAPSAYQSWTCPTPGPLRTTGPTTLAGQTPSEFDLLRHWVNVDRVSGLHLASYDTARYWQRIELSDNTGHTTVDIQLYARGGQPVFPSRPSAAPVPVDPTAGTPAAPVAGSPAYWLPGRQGLDQYEVARLGWRWGQDAWAFVAAADTSPNGVDAPKSAEQIDQLRAVVRHVADNLRLGSGAAVTSPFTVAVPNCARLTGTALMRSTRSGDTPFTRVMFTFGRDGNDNANPLLFPSSGPTFTVTADSAEVPQGKPGSVTGTIDGHPAAHTGSGVILYGVDGFALELVAPGGEEQAITFGRTVYIVPGAARSESAWTASPFTYGRAA